MLRKCSLVPLLQVNVYSGYDFDGKDVYIFHPPFFRHSPTKTKDEKRIEISTRSKEQV